MTHPLIAVIGDTCVDEYVFCSVDRLNPEGPVPLLSRQKSVKSLGMAGNVAVMVAALGARPMLVCTGGEARVHAVSAGLSIDWIVPSKRRMIRKTRYMAASAGRTYHQMLRVDDEVIPSQRDEALEGAIKGSARDAISKCHVAILSDYGKGTIPAEIAKWVCDEAHAVGVPVIVDPCRSCNDWSRYRNATVIKANRYEATAAGFAWRSRPTSGCRSVTEPAHNGDWESSHVVVTLDKDGFVLATPQCEISYGPSSVRSVSDVVGCGDQFAAAMAVAIAGGFGDDRRSIERACLIGNIAAGLQVGRCGCVPVDFHDLFPILPGL